MRIYRINVFGREVSVWQHDDGTFEMPSLAHLDGFDIALKPSYEPWWLVRKPCDGTIAENVITYGTGCLNIDGCRIATDDKLTRELGKTTTSPSGWKSVNRSPVAGKDGARWPSHLIVSHAEGCKPDACAPDCPTRMLGNASRFFTPKPSRREREAGCENLPRKSAGEATGGRREGSAGLSNPRAGAGRTTGTSQLRLRDDLTAEELAYVIAELEKHGVVP